MSPVMWSLRTYPATVGQLALQGPKALDVLKKVADPDAIPDKYYTFKKDCCIDGDSLHHLQNRVYR